MTKLSDILPVRATNCLKAIDICTLEELYSYAVEHEFSERAFVNIRNMGKVSLGLISELLYKKYGKPLLSHREIVRSSKPLSTFSVNVHNDYLIVVYNGHKHCIASDGYVTTV